MATRLVVGPHRGRPLFVSLATPKRTPTATGTTRCFSGGFDLTPPGCDDNSSAKFCPVYVHHLSKNILEHLQNNHAQWILDRGLDKGLKLNPDGTFVLQFPGQKENGRIWTSYDGGKKQHWLSVYKSRTLQRFLIKDVLGGDGHSETHQINNVVRNSVDQLISQLDGWEEKSKH